MAKRTLTYRTWLRDVARTGLGDALKSITGFTAVETAARLGVSRARVYQLLEEDALDTLCITTDSGVAALTLITEASLDRYLATRVPDRNRKGYYALPA